MKYTKSSQIILKNKQLFIKKHVLCAGNIQDTYPICLTTLSTNINVLDYHIWLVLKRYLKNNLYFGLIKKNVLKVNSLIYFWPKNKLQALFQLNYLITNLSYSSQIFIVGENNSGVKSSIHLLRKWINLKKIDSARKSNLITGTLTKQFNFNLSLFFKTYVWNNIIIKVLPGVFGYKGIDKGSLLLMSTFTQNIKGKILDIGSGSGILSIYIFKNSLNKILLTLTDISSEALISSKRTLKCNNVQGKVIASDLYSNINEKFNLIISNPPLHNDLTINKNLTKKLIKECKIHLFPKGELRIVVNSYLSYSKDIKENFGNCSILRKTKKFKVYQAFLDRLTYKK